MICKNCHKEIRKDSIICPLCGCDPNESLKKTKSFSPGKFILAAVCVLFIATAIYFAGEIAAQKNSTAIANESTTKAEITKTVFTSLQSSDVKADTFAQNEKDNPLFACKTKTFPFSSQKSRRAEITIDKETGLSLSQRQFKAFCSGAIEIGDYSHFTIRFDDSSGLVFPLCETEMLIYGKIGENGLISEILGYVIMQESGDYEYIKIPSAANHAETQNQTTAQTQTETSQQGYAELSSQTESTAFSSENVSEMVYVTSSGTKFHKSGCSYLKKSSIAMDKDEALKKGYSPCSRCKP